LLHEKRGTAECKREEDENEVKREAGTIPTSLEINTRKKMCSHTPNDQGEERREFRSRGRGGEGVKILQWEKGGCAFRLM